MRPAIVAVLVCLFVAVAVCAAGSNEVVAPQTGQVALAQPKVRFELRDVRTGRPLPSRPDELGELLGVPEPYAFLDTGAGGWVFSKATAERFRLRRDEDARYVEIGMAGEHAMSVSVPYTIVLGRSARRGPAETRVFEKQRLLLNDDTDEITRLLGVLGGAVDVVGMPAIRQLVVEIQSTRATDEGVPVRIHRWRRPPRNAAELWLPLELEDFNRRRHPKNHGALPTLAENPVVPAVVARLGDAETSGDWLLDTGSAVTVISTSSARALGLLDAAGDAVRPAAFTLPMGGISGRTKLLSGWRLDRIELSVEGGRTLVLPRPWVVVHDVRFQTDRGEERVLPGILGMNVLLRSGVGFTGLGFEKTLPPAASAILIDGPRSRLGITLRTPGP